jgi:hypothetical protein
MNDNKLHELVLIFAVANERVIADCNTTLAAIHELKFAIGRYEGNGPIDIKAREPYAPAGVSE